MRGGAQGDARVGAGGGAGGGARLSQLPLAPVPESVPVARDLLRELVADGPFAHRLHDGELALSELVTNAVLHGREPIVLCVRVTSDVLRVEVSDASAVSPSFSWLDPTAVTGRGLLLISAMTDRWGVEPAPHGKVVWFEVDAATPDPQAGLDVDALLASWGDDLAEDPALEQVRIVLTDLDVELTARSESHVEGLLRELTLAVAAGSAPAAQLRVASNVLRAAAAIDPVRVDLRAQLSQARARGRIRVDVLLSIQRDDAELVRDFAHAVAAADRLSRTGRLLMAPAPVELSDARQAYLSRILAQLWS